MQIEFDQFTLAQAVPKKLVWAKTLSVLTIFITAIVTLYGAALRHLTGSKSLALAAAFLIVQTLAICGLLSIVFWRKIAAQIQADRNSRIFPKIQRRLAAYIIEASDHSNPSDHTEQDRLFRQLRKLSTSYPDQFESCMTEFLPSLMGDGRGIASHLSKLLGLDIRWIEQSRSPDPDRREQAITNLGYLLTEFPLDLLKQALGDAAPGVRLAGCRVLIRSKRPEDFDHAFLFALHQPLFIRAILAEELHPRALDLAGGAIRRSLGSNDRRIQLATMEILQAWQKALPLPEIESLLWHKDPGLRASAFRTLPYAMQVRNVERAVTAALAHGANEVKAAAAAAAARLGVGTAARLAVGLRDQDVEVARASALALTEFGEQGLRLLEEEILSPHETAASAAFEALERERLSRNHYR